MYNYDRHTSLGFGRVGKPPGAKLRESELSGKQCRGFCGSAKLRLKKQKAAVSMRALNMQVKNGHMVHTQFRDLDMTFHGILFNFSDQLRGYKFVKVQLQHLNSRKSNHNPHYYLGSELATTSSHEISSFLF